MIIACLQMTSCPDVTQNMDELKQQCLNLPKERPLLLCLPEGFACFAGAADANLQLANNGQADEVIKQLAALCQEHNIWLSAGTIPLPASQTQHWAASLLFNAQGEVVGRYHKMHLFDVEVADGTGQYQESRYTAAGNEVVVVDSPFGPIGLSVCYDVRFPALYNKMRLEGAEMLLVPSAFTCPTGEAHWHALLRARAIENQCYVVAAAQVGDHGHGRHTYGHSVIISPWGEIVAENKKQRGLIYHTLDRSMLEQIRAKMPIILHTKFTCELKNEF